MDLGHYEVIKAILGEPFAQQFLIWTTSLIIASWIHAGRVRTELKSITEALNSLSMALKKDLESHSTQLDKIETRLDKIDKTVSTVVLKPQTT